MNSNHTMTIEFWKMFLSEIYHANLLELKHGLTSKKSLFIDFQILTTFGSEGFAIADLLLKNPDEVFADIKEAFQGHDFQVRFFNLPKRIILDDVREDRINILISIMGEVEEVRAITPRIEIATYQCPAGHYTSIKVGLGNLKKPDRCGSENCKYMRFKLVPELSKIIDTQQITINISSDFKRKSRNLLIDLYNDVFYNLEKGDRIIINGILRCNFIEKQKNNVDLKFYIEANSIEICESTLENIISNPHRKSFNIDAITKAKCPERIDVQIKKIIRDNPNLSCEEQKIAIYQKLAEIPTENIDIWLEKLQNSGIIYPRKNGYIIF